MTPYVPVTGTGAPRLPIHSKDKKERKGKVLGGEQVKSKRLKKRTKKGSRKRGRDATIHIVPSILGL